MQYSKQVGMQVAQPIPARAPSASPQQTSLKFGLIVQRSDGELSVIDPKIENSGRNR